LDFGIYKKPAFTDNKKAALLSALPLKANYVA